MIPIILLYIESANKQELGASTRLWRRDNGGERQRQTEEIRVNHHNSFRVGSFFPIP